MLAEIQDSIERVEKRKCIVVQTFLEHHRSSYIR